MKFINRFPHYFQLYSKDCGPTCLRIISKYYGKQLTTSQINKLFGFSNNINSFLTISHAAEKIGFRSTGAKIALNDLIRSIDQPCIIPWGNNHFAVLYKIENEHFYISDPSYGKVKIKKVDFLKNWSKPEDREVGYILLLEPTPIFYEDKETGIQSKNKIYRYTTYLKKYKKSILYIIVSLLFISLLQLILPFITQNIVDIGIKNNDLDFVIILLISQFFIFFGKQTIEILRSWIIVNIGLRVNLSLVSDFLVKLFSLPLNYFSYDKTGDVINRIGDNARIQSLLTNSSVNILFSIINLFMFSLVLIYYSPEIFLIFITGTIIYFLYIIFFLNRRKLIDYKRFHFSTEDNDNIIELLGSIQEIKMNNAEKYFRWKWQSTQAKLLKNNIDSLIVDQFQSSGSSFINEIKNIFISYYSAKLVIEGEISFGILLSISYIVGQLSNPIGQLINFTNTIQNAKISLDRLDEVFDVESEKDYNNNNNVNLVDGDINIKSISFKFPLSQERLFNKFSLTIPKGKFTAIVGESGCGKTTLMKLLLGFYEIEEGSIEYGNYNLNKLSEMKFRESCGIVIQEGKLFNLTIEKNIALGDEIIDYERLEQVSKASCLNDFIEALPNKFDTRIGKSGISLSQGQKQRLLIARSLYSNPDYLFYDEATSALDSNTERIIMNNLLDIFVGKTVIFVAHRLSTIINADQIVVLDKGLVVEVGNHIDLIKKRGKYYELVKNQMINL